MPSGRVKSSDLKEDPDVLRGERCIRKPHGSCVGSFGGDVRQPAVVARDAQRVAIGIRRRKGHAADGGPKCGALNES